ncbi:MAG: hypothetical protein HQL31_10475, partial [Planctomycetes bacterium]|nr:hypothetical protein [Planctomycetota bacterium]
LSLMKGQDIFRVRSLERMLRAPHLPPPWRAATLETLKEKLRILALGCAKYGKEAEAERYLHRRGQLLELTLNAAESWL